MSVKKGLIKISVWLLVGILAVHFFLYAFCDKYHQYLAAKFNAPEIKIFVTYYKPYQLPPKGEMLVPIQVGRAIENEPFMGGKLSKADIAWLHQNMIGDDTGDNISAKNRSFDVLTAYYWVWKHYQKIGNPQYIGFFAHRKPLLLHTKKAHRTDDDYNQAEFLRILEKYKVIYLPVAIAYENSEHPISLYSAYELNHHIEDFDAMLEIIKRDYPEIYKTAENIIFDENRVYAAWNYWVMEKTLAFDYFEKLFHVMFELEKNIGDNVQKRDFYQRRAFGFLAERFYAIWLEYQRKKNGIRPYEAYHHFSD